MTTVRSIRLRPAVALLAVLALAAVAALSPTAAQADRLADARAEADQVEQELQALSDRVAQAAEAYNAAQLELDETNAAIAENEKLLDASRQNLRVSRQELSRMLINAYRRGDADMVAVLLNASSINDLVDQSRFMERATAYAGQVVRDVRRYARDVKAHERELAAEKADREAALDARTAEKAAIQGALAERQALLGSLSGEIARIIQQREAARRAEAQRLAGAAGDVLAAAQAEAEATAEDGDDLAIGGSADVGAAIAAPPSSSTGGAAASAALSQLGVPYLWAGDSPGRGFDCSGLIMWAYAQVGVSLPHNAAAQYGMGTPVPLDALEPGDIVSFHGSGHSGIYIGGGQYVHAPQTGDVVKVSNLSDRSDMDGAVRVS